MTLTWNSAPSAKYTVRYSSDLSVPTSEWTTDTADVASGGGTTTMTTITAFDQASLFLVVEEQ